MKDSEIIARLIYATVVPCPTKEDMDAFIVALGCYSRQLLREEAEELPAEQIMLTNLKRAAIDDAVAAAWGESSNGPPAPDPDTPPEPEPADTHTHTHTAGTNDGGAGTPADFAGYGAGEKRTIYAELMAFIATHGLGARRKIAERSNGALTLSDVQDMTDAKRLPLSKWRAARAAMEQIEETEKNQT